MPRSIDIASIAHSAPIPAAARVGPLLCSSAIPGKSQATGTLPADGAEQVRCAFENLESILALGGAQPADVARLTVWLKDLALRDAVNVHWLRLWPDAHARPARHTTQHELGHGMLVQLEFLAWVGEGR